MSPLLDSPAFGILLSILTFQLSLYIYKKTKFSLFNPLLISISLIIALLVGFNIPFEKFNKGGEIISFFLGPATVILAVPLYKQMELLKKHIHTIFIGIFSGVIASIISVISLAILFKLDKRLVLSLIPKSITTPVGMVLSENIGGIPSITVMLIITTGITGAIIAPFVFKILNIHNGIARGLAMGTASHALGTSKALEMGETEGAMSGLSIGISAVITVLIAPLLIKIFSLI